MSKNLSETYATSIASAILRTEMMYAEVSVGSKPLSTPTYIYFLVIHAVVFFGVITVQAKFMLWLANFSQDFGSAENEFLKSIQLQFLNFLAFIVFIQLHAGEPFLVVIFYVVLAVFFLIICVSLMYRILLMKSATYFFLFELLSVLLWGIAYTLRGMFF